MFNLFKKYSGYSLIELMLVVGVVGAIAVSGLIYWSNYSSNNDLRIEIKRDLDLIDKAYASAVSVGNFNNFSNASLSFFPAEYFETVWHTPIVYGGKVIGASAVSNAMTIQYQNLNLKQCVKLSLELSEHADELWVNSSPSAVAGFGNQIIIPSSPIDMVAVGGCADHSNNQVTLAFAYAP